MAKICVVEDEPQLLKLIKEELEDLGHNVATAENGRVGVKVIGDTNPDVIISDINMPDMNGYQMFAALKDQLPEQAKKPFLFLSAYAEKSDIADGMLTGATAYLTKPVDIDALIAWVESLVPSE